MEGADDGVLPDDAVGERAAAVRTRGLRRGETTPAQAEHGDLVPRYAERSALADRYLADLAEAVLHDLLGGAHPFAAIGAANWLAVAGLVASFCQGSTYASIDRCISASRRPAIPSRSSTTIARSSSRPMRGTKS